MSFDVWSIAQIIILALMVLTGIAMLVTIALARPARRLNRTYTLSITHDPVSTHRVPPPPTPAQLHGVYVPPNAKAGMYVYTVEAVGGTTRHYVNSKETYDAILRLVSACPNADRCTDPAWCERCGSCREARAINTKANIASSKPKRLTLAQSMEKRPDPLIRELNWWHDAYDGKWKDLTEGCPGRTPPAPEELDAIVAKIVEIEASLPLSQRTQRYLPGGTP